MTFNASAKLSVSVIVFFVVTPPNTMSRPTEASSTLIESVFKSPMLVMFPSVTVRLVTVVAPAPKVPEVERFSFPKDIAPLVSVMLPSFITKAPVLSPPLCTD